MHRLAVLPAPRRRADTASAYAPRVTSVDEVVQCARTSGARFDPVLTESALSDLEEHLGVALPAGYRASLARVGAGCPDGPPSYGLAAPGTPTKELGASPRDPALPFPLTSPWVWEDEEEIDEPLLEAVWEHGWIWLGTDGCGSHWALVTAGSARGQVWNIADVGAGPYRSGATFDTWLVDWLDLGPLWRSQGDGFRSLERYERPVAGVDVHRHPEGRGLRIELRRPSDARPPLRACGVLEVVVDDRGRAVSRPRGQWLTRGPGRDEPGLRMTFQGAALLWDHVRPDALAASQPGPRRWPFSRRLRRRG